MFVFTTNGFSVEPGASLGRLESIKTSVGEFPASIIMHQVNHEAAAAIQYMDVGGGQKLGLTKPVFSGQGKGVSLTGEEFRVYQMSVKEQRLTAQVNDEYASWALIKCEAFPMFEGDVVATGVDFQVTTCPVEQANSKESWQMFVKDGVCTVCGAYYPAPYQSRHWVEARRYPSHPSGHQVIQWETVGVESGVQRVSLAGLSKGSNEKLLLGAAFDQQWYALEPNRAMRVKYRGKLTGGQDPISGEKFMSGLAWQGESYLRWDGSQLVVGQRAQIFPEENLADWQLKYDQLQDSYAVFTRSYLGEERTTDALNRNNAEHQAVA